MRAALRETPAFALLLVGGLFWSAGAVAARGQYLTIIIDANGTVHPADAPIERSNNFYALTADILYPQYLGLTVQRSGVVIDGDKHVIRGNGQGAGVLVQTAGAAAEVYGVTIQDTVIENFRWGMYFGRNTHDNMIHRNTIAQCETGVYTTEGNNKFWHNNFIDNASQVDINDVYPWASQNIWDDGYESGGNYWSNYGGEDVNVSGGPNEGQSKRDGIGDTAHVVAAPDDGSNVDNFALMQPLLPSVRNISRALDYYTIQEGVDAAGAGETIRVLPTACYDGTCYEQVYYEEVCIDRTLWLFTFGSEPAVIDGIRGDYNVVTITGDHAYLKGFTIQNAGSGRWGLYLDNSRHSHVVDNRVLDNANSIGLVNGSDHTGLSHNYAASGAGAGVQVNSSQGVLVIANKIRSNGTYGIVVQDSNNAKLVNNDVTSNTDGIYVTGVSCEGSIRGNKIGITGDFDFDGSVDWSDLETFSSGWLSYGSSADLDSTGRVDYADFALFAGHWLEEPSGTGILVDAGRDANTTIVRNRVASSYCGINLVGTSGSSVCENTVSGGVLGVKLDYAASNVVENNVISSHSSNGVLLTSSSGVCIRANEIVDNDDGVYLRNDSSQAEIADNRMEDNARHGIEMGQSWNCNIRGNLVVGSQSHGLYFSDSNSNTISKNQIMNNTGYGIRLVNRSEGNNIYHNIFVDNALGNAKAAAYLENSWDAGYPAGGIDPCDCNCLYGGNFWSDYSGVDANHGQNQDQVNADYPEHSAYGIGDESYVVDVNNVDDYPVILVSYKITKPARAEMKADYTLALELTNDTNQFIEGGTVVNFGGLDQLDPRPGSWFDWVPDLPLITPEWDLSPNRESWLERPAVEIPPEPPGNTAQFAAEFENEWNWINPNGWGTCVLDIICSLPARKILSKVTTAASVIRIIQSCYEASKAVPAMTYSFEPNESPLVILSTDVTVKVPLSKQLALLDSIVAGVAALKWASLASAAPDPATKTFCAAEAVLHTLLSILLYDEAEDPDPNYTQLTQLERIGVPYEVNSLPEGKAKRLACAAIEMVSLEKACRDCLIRYEFAKTADGGEPNEYYMALQSGAAQRYSAMAISKLEEMRFLEAAILQDANAPALSDADVNDFRDDIDANGLGGIHEQIFRAVFDPNDVNEVDVVDLMLAATDANDANAQAARAVCKDGSSIYNLASALIQGYRVREYALEAEAEAANLTALIESHFAADLAITELWADANRLPIGAELLVHVGVENRGTGAADANVGLSVLGDTETVVGNQTKVLSAGETATLTFVWDTNSPEVHPGSYEIRATAQALPGEKFVADNNDVVGVITVWDPYDVNPPGSPADLVAEGSGTTVSLSWSAPSDDDIAGYEVHRRVGGYWTHIGYAAQTEYVDSGLAPGSYEYAVCAYDLAGNMSGLSEQAWANLP